MIAAGHAAMRPVFARNTRDTQVQFALVPKEDLFERGFGEGIRDRLGARSPDRHGRSLRTAVAIAVVCWLPLAVFTAAYEVLFGGGALASLAADAKIHANLLVAAPLLVLADNLVGPRLTSIVRHFYTSGIVPKSGLSRFRNLCRKAHSLITARAADIAALAIAYVIALGVVLGAGTGELKSWHFTSGGHELSAAGLWHLLVSLPLLVAILMSWCWRLIVWAWLLTAISRLDLKLLPAHPDRTGGLGFVGHSLRSLAVVAFAVGVMGAGTAAERVIDHTATLAADGARAAVLVLGTLFILMAPLLVFLPRMMSEWWRGTFAYDALALRLGRSFENRWFADRRESRSLLQAPDFSAAADLYQVVGNVHAMRTIPIDLRSALLVVAAVLLPFLPVFLFALPTEVILGGLRSLIL